MLAINLLSGPLCFPVQQIFVKDQELHRMLPDLIPTTADVLLKPDG